MYESMSKLEIARILVILKYLEENDFINSSKAAEMLHVEIKTAGRLLSKAYKIGVLDSKGKTKNKLYCKNSINRKGGEQVRLNMAKYELKEILKLIVDNSNRKLTKAFL